MHLRECDCILPLLSACLLLLGSMSAGTCGPVVVEVHERLGNVPPSSDCGNEEDEHEGDGVEEEVCVLQDGKR